MRITAVGGIWVQRIEGAQLVEGELIAKLMNFQDIIQCNMWCSCSTIGGIPISAFQCCREPLECIPIEEQCLSHSRDQPIYSLFPELVQRSGNNDGDRCCEGEREYTCVLQTDMVQGAW